MTAVKHQVAHMDNIGVFKVNHTVSVCMGRTIIVKTDFLLVKTLAPGVGEGLVGQELFVH